jgi:threonine dehydrogenase-like Zn-dependent dehydrogenase
MKDVSDMRTVRTGALMVAGAVVGRTVARTIARRQGGSEEKSRGLAITVNAPPDKVAPLAEAVRGAQQHGQRYIPMLLDRLARGELSTTHLATHELSLEEGAKGYDLFKHKKGRLRPSGVRPISVGLTPSHSA